MGSGILRTPGEIAGYLKSPSLIFAVWTLGGAYALLCSSSVAELGTMLPAAGGWYVYSRRAFGEKTGFIAGCCDWMVQSVANAYLAVALGEFAAGLVPELAPYVRWTAAGGLIFFALLNWIGLRTGSRAQELTSLAKGLALLALVVACFTIAPRTGAAPGPVVANLLGQNPGLFLGLLLALQGVIITYDGWYAPIYFVEEDRDPARNLPRSLIGTTLACVGIYLLVNAALFHVLHLERLAGSLAPAADAASLIFGSYGRQLILIISVVAVTSTINAGMLLTPRILYGMAHDGLLPRGVASINKGGTPVFALFLCASASVALVLIGTFDTLIAIGAILFVAVYLSGFISLLVLRKREPALPRPYKAWWYPWSTIVVLLASVAFLVGSVIADPKHSLFTVVLILLSYVASFLLMRKNTNVSV